MKRAVFIIVTVVFLSVMLVGKYAFPGVLREGGKTYIVDRTGEKWDVSQAVTLGFKPEKFQYGLGRDAFTPLDETYLSDRTGNVFPELRVIGVEDENEAGLLRLEAQQA